MNNKLSILFTPSGCLTADELMQFVNGSLKGSEFIQAQQHIAECDLCADAAEGLSMWLNEKKSVAAIASELTESPGTEVFGLSGNQPDSNTNITSITPPHDFQARADKINERVRQRLHAHALIEKAGNKSLTYKPYAWLAAAATLLLFIVAGYILWMQTQADSKKLAQKPGVNSAMNPKPFGTAGYQELPLPPSQSRSVLTIKYDRKKGDNVPPVLAIVTEEARVDASGK